VDHDHDDQQNQNLVVIVVANIIIVDEIIGYIVVQ